MISIINNLFGVYTPLVDSAGNYVTGLAGVDWPWIFGALLFAITLISCFKIIGTVIKHARFKCNWCSVF